jgi:glycosyltransferase involved in cell wall biosynthesis
MPRISVLLPVRNAAPWLDASLASLWRQTFVDFEVIAVDDGSTDASGDVLDRAAARERRLRVVHTPPVGLPAALNQALALARATLVARQDADDLSHRRRLELQHDFLARHRRVSVVGCRVRLFPSAGAGMRRWAMWHNGLLSHEEMAQEVLIDSPLAHGTALVRRSALRGVGGWQDHSWPEDLDLWLRLLEAGHRFAKLPRTLYAWRQHADSATHRDPRYRTERFVSLRSTALARTVLRGATRATLVGVGRSLETWRRALAGLSCIPRVIAVGRPTAATLSRLVPPVVLVFGAAPARYRWRAALETTCWREGSDFTFVA